MPELSGNGPNCIRNKVMTQRLKKVNAMKKIKINKFRAEEGQSVVEAALVIPLFILILCGILDFGWILSNQLKIDNCAREGARYASIQSSAANLTTLVAARVDAVSGLDSAADIDVTVTLSGSDVSVLVTRDLKVLTPLAGIFVKDQTVHLESVTVMRIG